MSPAVFKDRLGDGKNCDDLLQTNQKIEDGKKV